MDHDAKDTDYLKNLGPVLEEYADWFGNISMAVAYSDSHSDAISTPQSYRIWQKETESSEAISANVLKSMTETYEDMVMEGRAIVKILADGQKPELTQFEKFKDRYNKFFRQIRRLERDSAMEESGLDEQTGLRSSKSIEGDMKRELERLERQGTAFCQVMLRIDQFTQFDNHDEMLQLVVKTMRDTIRPFDDAYYLNQGHFLINMKQTDLIGAEAGINRIRIQLSQHKENTNPITLSFCVIEPVTGEEADKMLRNLRQDLDENAQAEDAVLKHKEISELERFVGNIK
jgi:GGDEF domain-containing protein